MAEINKTPDPQEMIRQITQEADDFLTEYGGDLSDDGLHDDVIRLIAQAWNLPATDLEACLAALREERERRAADTDPEPAAQFNLPAPRTLVSLLWGLFGTAVRLNRFEDRSKLLNMAVYLADCLGLDDALPEA